MGSLMLKNISKSFGDVKALSGIDLHVKEGEFCVLLGPSGCGKSTLLQIVAGLIKQDKGTVLIDERSVDSLSPGKRDVAMVFQNYALYPHMTVTQNLAFGLKMRGVAKASVSKQVLEVANLLGIEKLLDRKPQQLSGGQRQRVAMGRALVRRPKLFLLDEPLSNLDARLRVTLRLEIKRLHRQIRATMLYVTHDQEEAMTLGDKVVVLEDGRVHQVDSPEKVYHSPANTFVATFIGHPMMNLFKGKLRREGGDWLFQGVNFTKAVGAFSSDLEGAEVAMGIRPEDIRISQSGRADLTAEIEMISNMGAERYIHANTGDAGMTIRFEKEMLLKPGEMIPLEFDTSRIHIFYRGQRL